MILDKPVRSLSLDVFLSAYILVVPLAMFTLIMEGNNPYFDNITVFAVSLMSVFLVLVVQFNQRFRIPLLEVFIIVYVVFWHSRFLTLALFPSSELVLTRTVIIDHEIFNNYVWVVFVSLVATVIGVVMAKMYSRANSCDLIERDALNMKNLTEMVTRRIRAIVLYCLMALLYMVFATQIPEELLPSWIGYFGFFFPFSLVLFLVGLPLFVMEISRRNKLLLGIYTLCYVGITVLTGSRSILLYFVLSALFLLVIFGKKIRMGLGRAILILLLGLMMLFSFAYGTYQRHLRDVSGFGVTEESTQYIIEQISNIENWEPVLGLAFARAGYLDYSAEMFANPEYAEVVSIKNELKSTVDNYIPGAVFEDSKLIEQRIIDVYNPQAVGYQSDALGAVGETYLLFGYTFPFIMSLVAFLFTWLFYAVGIGIYGMYIKFSLAIGVMSWWNSFGYDWLLVDSGRQFLSGVFILSIIFYCNAVSVSVSRWVFRVSPE